MRKVKDMSQKRKLIISIVIGIFGLNLSLISYKIADEAYRGVVFGLGISIMTTAIIDIYKYIMNNSKNDRNIGEKGLLELEYNGSSSAQDKIYTNANNIRALFSAGLVTLRDQQNKIINSIINNNCNVRIIMSDESIIKSGMYITGENEVGLSTQIVTEIITYISKVRHAGSIELKYSPIAPIGSVEIRNDEYCVVVPYMYKKYGSILYHSTYKNTGHQEDIYHKWVQHFEDIWNKGKTILKYPEN